MSDNSCAQITNGMDPCTTTILVPKIFDAVTLRLNDAPCVITLTQSVPSAEMPQGNTTAQSARITDVTTNCVKSNYSSVSGNIVADGQCRFAASSCNENVYSCAVTLPFSVFLRYPSPSLFKPEVIATVSFSFTANKKNANSYSGVANGVAILSVCSYTPLAIPCAYLVCPENADARSRPESPSLPVFPHCNDR